MTAYAPVGVVEQANFVVAWLSLMGSFAALVAWVMLLRHYPAMRALGAVWALAITAGLYAAAYPWLLWLLWNRESAAPWSALMRPVGAVQWVSQAWLSIDLLRLGRHMRGKRGS